MAVDERARHRLHTRLDEVLGSDEATTLMTYLPPVGWSDVATKQDLARLESRLDDRFARIDDRFTQIDDRFTQIDDRFTQIDDRFARLDDRFARLDDRFTQVNDRMEATLHRELNRQTRTLFFSMSGLLLTIATLTFAALRLT